MFKGKVVIYQTDPKTWKVYHLEKEFDDPKKYEEFVNSHVNFFKGFLDFDTINPQLSLMEWANFERWIEDLIWRKLGLSLLWKEIGDLEYISEKEELPVDISKYEREVRKLEEERRKLEEKKRGLEEALNKLEKFKKEFEDAGRQDLVKQIEEDIKKVKDELKKVTEKNNNKKK